MQLYTKILVGMVAGTLLGIGLGPNSPWLEHDGVSLLPNAIVRAEAAEDGALAPHSKEARDARILRRHDAREGWLEIEWTIGPSDILHIEKARAKRDEAGAEPAPEPLPQVGSRHRGWVDGRSPSVQSYARVGQRLVDATEWIGRLFLALIKMVVVPLVFFSLTVGVASLGDFRRLGRLGVRTVALFTGTTVVALIVGVGLANWIRPGALLSASDRAQLVASYEGAAGKSVGEAADAPSLFDQIVGIVPTNPVEALAKGEMLQIIFFALMFGVALTLMPERRSKPLVALCDHANEAMVVLVHIAMKLAPLGVAALLFKVVGSTGLSVLLALGAYTLVVLAGLIVHFGVTYATLVRFAARLPFWRFVAAIRPALLLAFSTSSSSATLPVTKECAEDNLNVSKPVASFVIPLGATINMDGTALYQGVAALFIAQIYGMQLGFGEQATIVLSATLASVGAAGVPGAGMITLAMVLSAIGVPAEGLALVLGVDRLLDMFRTTVNVVGDSTVTVVMARLEGDPLRILSRKEDVADPRRGFEGRIDHSPRPVVGDVDEPE